MLLSLCSPDRGYHVTNHLTIPQPRLPHHARLYLKLRPQINPSFLQFCHGSERKDRDTGYIFKI